MTATGIRWKIHDRYGNEIYLTHERWQHITASINHPDMVNYEEHLKATIQHGRRKQDSLNPQKYRYTNAFIDLPADNTHITAIVLFRFREGSDSEPISNNYIVTAYQKRIR
ncbi:MAG: hypothetical protein OXH00_02400 [Candidatus Poribacteria bacterium]|nr:hypothetical protein [Candidatus Poribacteria bacterium]